MVEQKMHVDDGKIRGEPRAGAQRPRADPRCSFEFLDPLVKLGGFREFRPGSFQSQLAAFD